MKPHVVVVNDDPIQLLQLGEILKTPGYEVSAFSSATDLLSGLAGHPLVSLFVVDLHMPGIDGWKLCRLLRSPEFRRFNGTPILVVSATFTGDDVASITRELGANGFLEAPFEPRRLLEYVETLLAGEFPRKTQSLLVVEDDAEVRRVLARAFAAEGYETREAASGREALALLASERVDVALLDYHLPDGTVEDLLPAFRERDSRTSLLIMTGDTDPVLPVRLLAQGADGYLRKPFDPGFAVELARKSARQRALLRIESILEARTRELKASEARYRILFDTIPDLVMVVDARGHLLQVNPEGLLHLGARGDEVLGRHVVEVAKPEEARTLSRWLGARQRGAGPERMETELLGPGELGFPVELTGRAVEFNGAPALLVVGRDLTDRRRAEAERRQMEDEMRHAQRLESLGVLAGGVAHDFNNLLVGILGNASLALMDVPDDSPVQESLRQVELAARRAAELTQQILAFAGKARVVSQDVDLAALVREMGQLMEPAISKKARLSLRLPPHVPAVRADAGQMRQVVMNLIMNASDALAGQPGDIRVEVSTRELPGQWEFRTVGATTPDEGRYVALEVVDTGCGMDEATASRIFEPFFTTKPSGRGLGLASTLGILRAHGGHVSLRTAAGRGTSITVLLPALGEVPRRAPEPAPGERRMMAEGGTILLVDDEPAVRGLARTVLTRCGYEVLEAADGRRGLELALERGEGLDLVVLDMTMPEMDGDEVLAAIRRRYPRLPVLLSSGYPPDEIGPEEPTAFLRKPYAPAELREAVDGLVVRQDARGNARY